MKLPHWLLRLLPMWDYICPKCKKQVAKNSHKCVYCGEQYNIPVRVPPRVLKDPKALEDYVHKHVFPKVSASQREYLTQFFTDLFAHGFEGGDFGTDPETGHAWSGTTETSGADITVESTDPHHGTYHAESDIPTGTSVRSAYCYKNGLDADIVYIRQYVKFLDALVSGTSEDIMVQYGRAGSTGIFQIGVRGLSAQWGGNYRIGTTWTSWYSDPSTEAELGVWYCVETGWYKNATSGWFRVWVDDDQIFEDTNINTNQYGNLTEIRNGVYRSYMPSSGSAHRVRLDCVVVADAYIGPISEGATYTKDFTGDALLKATQTKTFQTDAYLQATKTKTFAADAWLVKEYLKTFDLDALLKATKTKTWTLDAYLQKAYTKTLSLDAILQSAVGKSFTADAILQLTSTKTASIDAIIRKVVTQTLTVDAILKGTYTKTFDVDAILSTPDTVTFEVDAFLKAAQSKTVAVDAYLQKPYTKTATIDAYIQQALTKTFKVDAYLQAPEAASFTVDAYLQATQTQTFTIDAILVEAAKTKTFTINALLKATLTKTFTMDAIVGVIPSIGTYGAVPRPRFPIHLAVLIRDYLQSEIE